MTITAQYESHDREIATGIVVAMRGNFQREKHDSGFKV